MGEIMCDNQIRENKMRFPIQKDEFKRAFGSYIGEEPTEDDVKLLNAIAVLTNLAYEKGRKESTIKICHEICHGLDKM